MSSPNAWVAANTIDASGSVVITPIGYVPIAGTVARRVQQFNAKDTAAHDAAVRAQHRLQQAASSVPSNIASGRNFLPNCTQLDPLSPYAHITGKSKPAAAEKPKPGVDKIVTADKASTSKASEETQKPSNEAASVSQRQPTNDQGDRAAFPETSSSGPSSGSNAAATDGLCAFSNILTNQENSEDPAQLKDVQRFEANPEETRSDRTEPAAASANQDSTEAAIVIEIANKSKDNRQEATAEESGAGAGAVSSNSVVEQVAQLPIDAFKVLTSTPETTKGPDKTPSNGHTGSYEEQTEVVPGEDERDGELNRLGKLIDTIVLGHRVAIEEVVSKLSNELGRLKAESTVVSLPERGQVQEPYRSITELVQVQSENLKALTDLVHETGKAWQVDIDDYRESTTRQAQRDQDERAKELGLTGLDRPRPLRQAKCTEELTPNLHRPCFAQKLNAVETLTVKEKRKLSGRVSVPSILPGRNYECWVEGLLDLYALS